MWGLGVLIAFFLYPGPSSHVLYSFVGVELSKVPPHRHFLHGATVTAEHGLGQRLGIAEGEHELPVVGVVIG